MNRLSVFLGKKQQKGGGPSTFLRRLKEYSPTNIVFKNINYINKNSLERKLIFLLPKTYDLSFYFFIFSKKYPVILRLDGSSLINPGKYSLKILTKALLSDILTIVYIIFADHVVFQSIYTKNVWNFVISFLKKSNSIIYNPSPSTLTEYYKKTRKEKAEKINLICLEGSVQKFLAERILKSINNKYRVDIYGKVSQSLKNKFIEKNNIFFNGYINQDVIFRQIKALPYVYVCLEKNPPCPNSVLEMLSLGVPIIGLNSGSLGELIGEAGILIDPNEIYLDTFANLLNDSLSQIENSYFEYQELTLKRSFLFKEKYTLKKYLDLFEKYSR